MPERARTFAEKALGRASGLADIRVGEIIDVYPDLYMSHTSTWRCIATLERLGNPPLFDPDRVAIVLDHISPAATEKTAAHQARCRRFAEERGIEKFFDVNSGIAHLVLMEHGLVHPGAVIIGTDSHSTIYGALGAFGTGVGYSEVTAAWATGKLWMKVPASMKVELVGTLPSGVYAKDVMLRLIGDLTADGATYLSVEFHGSFVGGISVSQRMTLCNLAMELGAKNAFVDPDAVTMAFLAEAGAEVDEGDVLHPDPGAEYAKVVRLDIDDLAPQVACPSTVDNVRPITEVAGTRLDQIFIGSCANAKYDDLRIAADILRGQHVARNVRLIVTPGSQDTMAKAAADGSLAALVEAGALVTNPGCGACAGDGGAMASGEVTLSTANRNFQGRMGSYESQIYLSSPAAAAASALTGVISDPRDVVGDSVQGVGSEA